MTEWWRGGVIYQVYPRSFQDSNGDGVGDLPGIIARLDHIASLGVDCIWLSPITKSPQADMGYDVSDYCEIDPLFGSLEDFDTLVKQAHARGLKVIMDQVVSHTSDHHAWFQESRVSRTNARADWYVWADPLPDGSPPNNWPAVFGGSVWEWNGTRGQYYLHNFLTSQPDLNFHNPAVQDAVLDVMRFWLERGIDGFRLDTVNYYFHDEQLRSNPADPDFRHGPHSASPYEMQIHEFSKSQPENLGFLRRVRALLDQFPGATSVGEVGDSHRSVELMAQYTAGGDTLHMCYGFDFLGPQFTAAHFRSRIETFFEIGPDSWPCWSFSNHDVPRHVSRWAEHARSLPDLAHQTAALVLSLKGSVCLYQGEELGLTETDLLFEELTDPRGIRFWPEDKGRDGCRTPMPWDQGLPPNGFTTGKPWLPLKPEQSALNVAGQNADDGSTLAFFRTILAWRKNHPTLALGDITFCDTPEPVLAFRRSSGNDAMLCVFNLSADDHTVAMTGLHDGTSLEPVSERAVLSHDSLQLGANGFAFIALDSSSTATLGGLA
ncbi:alpha glucosidase [Devosia sp. BSSL-BM10]|uniref:Alpha glucosidase n=1 Tax=Devosia litorisediminis TaxID=2829817 RepID=A0A942E7I0_9HYPH|nr:alpha-glucosidase [Devosia litorisediminis]MBS3849470.1 alpha glucosidase [Devosia litorisediminis]